MIGVGVIGTGMAARTGHLPALAVTPGVEVVALADVSEQRLVEAASRAPAAQPYTDVAAFLAHPGLDAVVVATPPASHAALAAAALRHGKHVLVEKPLAPTVAECVEMARVARERGLTAAVGHEKRFHPTLERVRGLIAGQEIGAPLYCGVHWASNAKLAPDALVPHGYRHGYEWRWSDPDVGGGLVQDHLPHYVDLVRHWTGAEVEGVYAVTANVARDHLGWQPEASRWDDLGLVVARFSGGLSLRFETSVVGRSVSPIWSLGSGAGEWTEYGYVLGTEGQIVFDLLPWDSSEHGRIAVWRLGRATRDGEGWTAVEQPEPRRTEGSPSGAAAAMFRAQADHWIRAIRGESSRVATALDGAICVDAVEAAYRSAATRSECQTTIDLGATP